MIPLAAIRALPLLAGLPDVVLAEVARRAVPRRFHAGATLWRVGDPSRGLTIVLEGEVRLLRASGGRQHLIHREGRGATLGEVPLFAGGGYPALAIAASPVRCLFLSRGDLEAVMPLDGRLAWRLLERMGRRVRELVGRLDGRSGRTVAERLAAYLVECAGAAEGRGSAGFGLGQSQAALAEELGTVREVLVRELGRLCHDGVLVRTGRSRFRVGKHLALAALARGETR